MPMIRLTARTGSLTEAGREKVQRELAAVLLRWEGAPDTAFFRAQAWSCLVELPAGAQTTAEDDAPRYLVEVTVPQGALSERRRAGLVEDATRTVLEAAGLPPAEAPRVAIAVLAEQAGRGGEVASPIAGDLMELALEVVE